ncbi:unnamed protein product [Closterium sp. NIES-53]
MDVWGPARVSGQGRERYFLLVVDNYTRYTTVFPLRSKGEVSAVLIPCIRVVRLQLHERFREDLPVLRLHSDRGGEFSSHLLQDFCRGEGILQSFTLPDSPQQNGIAERRIGLVMEVARTSMIHAAAPHFLWPFAVRYAVRHFNLRPCVSLPETSPTLRWTGMVGDASVFRVWGSRAFVRDTSADKLSARAIPCVFLGFVRDALGWQFYHPTSRRVLPSQDVTFDESAPFYCLFPLRSAPLPPSPLFLAPGPPPVDPLQPQVQSFSLFSFSILTAASGGAEPGGAGSDGAGFGGAEPAGVEPGGAESEGAEPGGVESEGAESGGAEPRAPGASEPGDAGVGGAAVTTGAGDPMEPRAAGAGGAGAGVAGVGGPGAGGPGAAGARAVDPGAEGAGGTVRPHPYFVPLLQQVLGVPSSTSLPPPFLCPPPDHQEVVQSIVSERLVLSCLFALLVALLVRVLLLSQACTLWHSVFPLFPLRVPLPAPPGSSLPEVPDPETDRARAASPTVARLLAAAVTDPSFESTAASSLVAELLEFAAACRLDYASVLVAESVPTRPPSVGGECALGTDVLEDRQEDFECLAAAAAMDAEMASWKSTGTYVNEVPPPGVNIVDGMWIFRVKRPPGSPPAFKARYVARGFSQRQGVDHFHTFSPTPKMTILWVLLHVAAKRDYELHSLDFSTAFLQSSLHEEIWLRRPPGFTGSFPAGTQWSLRRLVYGLRKAPREWHDTLWTTLAALGFVPSTADPSLFLRTNTSLPPFYVLVYVDDHVFATADTEAMTLVRSELLKRPTCTDLGPSAIGFQYSSPQLIPLSTSHSLKAPPLDESVEPSGPYPELVGCLMYLMTCTRPDLAYPLSLLARYVAPGRHRKVHWDAAKRVQHYLCSTSGMGLVLGGRGPVVLTGHADASWVDDSATQRSSQGYTFSLGSGSVSCRSTRSSSQRGQLCLAYMATLANTANVFTKALLPGDHQRFVTVLGLRTTHEAAGPTGSHGNAAVAGAGYHQRLHAARLHLDQHRRRRHLHHHCRCLHHRCRCLHYPHCRHRSLHFRQHPHLHCHPLCLLHRLHHRPHRPLHHPCPPCPCWCGASH